VKQSPASALEPWMAPAKRMMVVAPPAPTTVVAVAVQRLLGEGLER
jgi:hypothetical protein